MTYLTRRNGRYYLQLRLSPWLATLFGVVILRRSLETADLPTAKRRLHDILRWLRPMNETSEPPLSTRVPMVLRELLNYLDDEWPVDSERIWARQNFQTMINNMKERLRFYEGIGPDEVESSFSKTYIAFITQTLQFEKAYLRDEAKKELSAGYLAEIETVRRDVKGEAFEQGRQKGWEEERDRGLAYFKELRPETPRFNQSPAPDIAPSEPPQTSTTEPLPDLAPPAPLAPLASKAVGTVPSLSTALNQYYRAKVAENGNSLARAGDPILNYLVHWFENCAANELSAERLLSFYQDLPNVPKSKGIPTTKSKSLAFRIEYAREHGWEGLSRMAEGTITDNWRTHIKSFCEFLHTKGWLDRVPIFRLTKVQKRELMVKLKKDRATPTELQTLLSSPPFTGCKSLARRWMTGKYYVQDYLFWTFLILLTTGMRTGEPASIMLSDIIEKDGQWYFNLYSYDPEKGRVANKDLRQGKSASASRMLPIHPLLILLGLLDRKRELEQMGAIWLFPEWKIYIVRKSGLVQWSRPITRSFIYFKEKYEIPRQNLTTYWTRHWYADILDRAGLPDRTRNMLLGHALTSAPNTYGGNQGIADQYILALQALNDPSFEAAARLLLEAKARSDKGELVVLKPHLTKSNWVDRTKFEHLVQDFGDGDDA